MAKKGLAILLCLTLLIGVTPVTALSVSAASCASAHDYTNGYDTTCNICGGTRTVDSVSGTSDGLSYTITADENGGYVSITGASVSDVVIPNEIDGCPVTEIAEYAFSGCFDGSVHVTRVVLPDSLKIINFRAFDCNTNLTKVVFGNSTTVIEREGLGHCDNLKEVVFGENANITFYERSFISDTSLTELKLPKGSVYGGAFYGCSNVTKVSLPISVIPIESSLTDALFMGADSAPAALEVVLTDGTSINSRLFDGCDNVTAVTVPDSVRTIAADAFADCTKLNDITIGSGVTQIGANAFTNTQYYTTFANWADGVLYAGQYLLGANSTISPHCVVADDTKVIAQGAFSNAATVLKTIFLPDSVVNINQNAFSGCTRLTDVWYAGSETDRAAMTVADTLVNNRNWHYDTCDEHTYGGICDAVCNDCEWIRNVSTNHVYDNAKDADCNVCGHVRYVCNHVYDYDCDAYCNLCGAVREADSHVYDHDCDTDCNRCGTVRVTEHEYTTDYDTTCDVCGIERAVDSVTDVLGDLLYTITPDANGGTVASGAVCL